MNESSRSIRDYRQHPFVGAQYEQVGQYAPIQSFEPITAEVVRQSDQPKIDPFFADYGDDVGARQTIPQNQYQGAESPDQGVGEQSSAILDSPQLQQLLEEERARGFAEGQSDAQSRLDGEIAAVRERMTVLCDELGAKVTQEVERIERQAIGLAILISRRIIAEAVEINPEYLLPIVREALGYVGGAEVHRVRISPADLEFVEIERIRERFDGSWSFVADPAIVSGCVIETNAGEVDYRLDAAWERLKDNVVRSMTA